MEDLSAASYDDVVAFFKQYYAPSNASLVVAGDLEPAAAKTADREMVRRREGRRPAPDPIAIPGRRAERRAEEDDHRSRAAAAPVSRVADAARTSSRATPRSTWSPTSSPAARTRGCYKRLVYDMQIAQDVSAFQASQALSSAFQIIATPRPGHTVAELQKVIDEEIQKLQREPPTAHELERSVNQIESSFFNRMERVGGFGGKADQLNALLHGHGRRRLVQRGSRRATARSRSATSAPPPRSSCRSTNASS